MHAPFFFLIDFEQQNPLIVPLDKTLDAGIYFDILGKRNFDKHYSDKCNIIPNIKIKVPRKTSEDSTSSTASEFDDGNLFLRKGIAKTSHTDTPHHPPLAFELTSSPMPFAKYQKGFALVQQELHKGNTYLLNLTYPTPIRTNHTLKDIFDGTTAPYKLYLKNKFVCFSPEPFVQIQGNTIHTYPMKGTIDAQTPNAKDTLLTSKKEKWEHFTIVDLMRNDLAMVASNIEVARFRYVDKINTHQGQILQTSSQISGTLPDNWRDDPLSVITPMLPAGSVSGAPKAKTLDIIRRAEGQDRGYYTGVFGVFDGENLYSAVIIRYIEQTANGLQFRSGGGITIHSDCQDEYQELLSKVYVPIV